MRRYIGTLANPVTGALQPGQLLSVLVSGTQTAAALFDAFGAPISNPLTTDANGQFAFFIHSGTYDFVDATGQLVLAAVQIFDHTNPAEWIKQLQSSQTITRRFTSITTAASVVIDATIADIYLIAVTATITAISVTPFGPGQDLTLMFQQPNAGGPFDISGTAWPSNMVFSGGLKPTLSQAANAIDVFDFTYTGTLWIQRSECRNES